MVWELSPGSRLAGDFPNHIVISCGNSPVRVLMTIPARTRILEQNWRIAVKRGRKFVGLVAMGVALGAGLGVVFGNIPIGVGAGLLIGLMVALARSRREANK